MGAVRTTAARQASVRAVAVLVASMAALTATLGAASSGVAVASGSSDAWTQTGVTAAQTEYNPGEHVLSVSAAKHLTKKWIEPKNGLSAVIGADVSGNTLYTNEGNGIHTYSMSTGHPGRKYKLPFRQLSGGPIIDGSRIITYSGFDLVALSKKTGKTEWKIVEKNTGATGRTWRGIELSGTTLFAVLQTSTSTTGAHSSKLMAISAATGKVIWSTPDLTPPMAVGNGMVYASGIAPDFIAGAEPYNNVVVAVDAATGAQAWVHQLGTLQCVLDITAPPGIVVVGAGCGTGSGVAALVPATGQGIWATKVESAAVGGSFATDGKTLVFQGYDRIYAVGLTTGTAIWSRPSGIGGAGGTGGIIGGDGVVYYAVNGKLHAVSLSSGAALWASKGYSTPVLVADGRLLAGYSNSDDFAQYAALGKK